MSAFEEQQVTDDDGDFGKRNPLVRNIGGRWSVAAVVDCEFAVSGPPPVDLGHLLRYEQALRPTAEPPLLCGLFERWRLTPRELAQTRTGGRSRRLVREPDS
ncbi:MAG: phosphotransferase [Terriglobales bacterium]